MNEIKQAVILAGGKGSRLRPYTLILPKPLMPLGDFPILEILIKKLRHHNITDIIIATGYLSHLIEAYFGDGKKFGVNIRYSHEDKPLGTAGPLKLIPNLDEDFLIMNGDLLTDLSFSEMIRFHERTQSDVTISVYSKKVKIDLGVLKLNENNQILDYIEKPTYDFDVSMGMYVLNRRVLEHIPEDYFDFPDLIKMLIKTELKVNAFKFEGTWLDVGRPDDYTLAMELFQGGDSEKFLT